jgi:hypothetical protein
MPRGLADGLVLVVAAVVVVAPGASEEGLFWHGSISTAAATCGEYVMLIIYIYINK